MNLSCLHFDFSKCAGLVDIFLFTTAYLPFGSDYMQVLFWLFSSETPTHQELYKILCPLPLGPVWIKGILWVRSGI
jgi:hypothetical protein